MIANKEIMAKNILKYMERDGVKATDICKALDVKQNTFSDWVNAKTYPRIDAIEKLANYFHVSKADLVEEQTTETDFDLRRIERARSNMPDSEKEKMMRVLEATFDKYFK